ncbi:MAG: putative RNA methyltransferase, partial [Oscillospiraceae bacterium]
MREGMTLRCPKGHCFDVSSKGYVNLLLSQHKNVKDPGDSKEMAAARRTFLSTGAYEPLLKSLCDAALSLTEGISEPVAADCGCGEGYYTAGIYDALAGSGKRPEICAVDISKNVLAAAKPRFAGKNIAGAAASVFRMPLQSGSVDLSMVIFAPFCTEELIRITKDGGAVMTAIPAREHLYGLKQVLYAKPYYNEVKPYEIEGLEFVGKKEISYKLSITEQEVLNALFMMTPYYYKTSREDSGMLYSYFGTHDRFETQIGFEILMYRK